MYKRDQTQKIICLLFHFNEVQKKIKRIYAVKVIIMIIYGGSEWQKEDEGILKQLVLLCF